MKQLVYESCWRSSSPPSTGSTTAGKDPLRLPLSTPTPPKPHPENAELLATESSQKVLAALAVRAQRLDGAVTAEQFKAWMNEIKTETGVKGKELFHPVRIALTGSHSGPEFDKLIPLIEEGSTLPLPEHIPSVRERVLNFITNQRCFRVTISSD